MHSFILATVLAAAATVTASPARLRARQGVDPALVPDLGIVAGTNPDGQGSCEGNNGVLISCNCPPSRDAFIAKLSEFVAAGNAFGTPVAFPADDEAVRRAALIVTLQNADGPGLGCPLASTTL